MAYNDDYEDRGDGDEGDDCTWNGQIIREIPRPCDRCGAGNVEYAKDRIRAALCGEVQMAFGLIAWLCHDCRKQWHKSYRDLPLHREYVLCQVEIEFWRARLGTTTPDSELERGINLANRLEDLELKINEIANHWLIME